MSSAALPGSRRGRSGAGRPGTGRPGAGRLAAALAAALVSLSAAGCGLKTAPRPVSELAPQAAGLRVRQFDEDVLISWRAAGGPGAERRAGRFGSLEAYALWIEELQPGCVSCPVLGKTELDLRGDAYQLTREREQVFYRFTPERRESGWRVRLAYRFDDGLGPVSPAVTMPGLSRIPRPGLRWEWIAPPVPGATAIVDAEARLAWEPVQERVVRVMSPGKPPEVRVQTYPANLYRREPDAPWPFTPLNGTPLSAAVYSDKPARALVQKSGGVFEYAVRWVDHAGGEGPLSESVRIPYSSPEPR